MDVSRFRNPGLMKRPALNISHYIQAADTDSEKWFKSPEGTWHYLTPEGQVYQRAGDGSYSLVGGVNKDYFFNPNGFTTDF